MLFTYLAHKGPLNNLWGSQYVFYKFCVFRCFKNLCRTKDCQDCWRNPSNQGSKTQQTAGIVDLSESQQSHSFCGILRSTEDVILINNILKCIFKISRIFKGNVFHWRLKFYLEISNEKHSYDCLGLSDGPSRRIAQRWETTDENRRRC